MSTVGDASRVADTHALDRLAMTLEKLWYELFPYLFGLAGLAATVSRSGSLLLKASGLLLLAVSGAIVGMRWLYRRQRL